MSNQRKFEPDFMPTFMGISDQIAKHGRFRSRDLALVEGDREVNWAEYDAAGNRIGHALLNAGVGRGDRVAMLAANCIWAHEVLLGIWRAGAVAVPLSTLLTPDSISSMLSDAGAKVLLANAQYADLARTASAGSDLRVITEGGTYDEFVESCPKTFTNVSHSADDLAVIIYSSGTTGAPKGIVHTHGARFAFASLIGSEFRIHYHSVVLSMIPVHSNGAWLGWLPAKLMGAKTVILPQFSADAFIELVRKHRPTHGFLVPTVCAVLLEHPEIERAGLECFETAITAGAPMPADVKETMMRLTNNGLYELWGLTEGVGTIICPQDMATHPQSVGRPFVSCDIRLINGNNEDITFTGTGEIVGHSASLMSGYWNRPEANAELVWKDENGTTFIRTGDIGEFDEDGFLTLRGRAKDMIISGGINVFPVDIESVLLKDDGVKDAAVIGVAHPKWGETPVAFVIEEQGVQIKREALRDWTNRQLAKHQRLSDIVVHQGDFPRNTLGKVLKNELRDAYAMS